MGFKIYWLDGREEIIEGETSASAFTKAGYGAGAVRAIDYYKQVKEGRNIHEEDS